LVALAIAARVMRVAAVPSMHKQMHERARENEEIRQVPECVREVLGPQQNEDDDQKPGANQEGA
jgi:hypothetical protein